MSEINNPMIGIWWDDGKTIVSFKQSTGKPERITGLCDSDYNHADFWATAAALFKRRTNDDYFGIPRGRVLWNPRKKLAINYHGNATDRSRLELIAVEFGLVQWIAVADLHNSMNGHADSLFFDAD